MGISAQALARFHGTVRPAADRGRDRTAGARAAAPAAAGVDRFVVGVLTANLALIMLLQKWAMPLPGDNQVSMLLLVQYGVGIVLFFAGRLRIDTTRLVLFLGFGGLAVGANIVADRDFSMPSLILGLLIYAALVPFIAANWATYARMLKNYQIVALVICALVFLGHLMQLAGLEMINLEKIIPASMLYREYVYIQPINWGSPFNKPNAIFLLEASHTSQMIALAIVIEVAFFQRLRWIIVYAVALLTTFAGTGLLLLLLTAPFLLGRVSRGLIVGGVVALPLLLGLVAVTGWFDVISNRFEEYEKRGSSANGRFVAPVEAVTSNLAKGDPSELLLGIGPGKMPRRMDVLWVPFSKVFMEYGIIVFLAWLAFVTRAFMPPGVPLVLPVALLVHYHVLNGSFLVPANVFLCYVLAGAFHVTGADRPRLPSASAPVTAATSPNSAT
jgi:hypothetical protein